MNCAAYDQRESATPHSSETSRYEPLPWLRNNRFGVPLVAPVQVFGITVP